MILLPVVTDNSPDWEYIESYMKSVTEEFGRNFKNLNEEK